MPWQLLRICPGGYIHAPARADRLENPLMLKLRLHPCAGGGVAALPSAPALAVSTTAGGHSSYGRLRGRRGVTLGGVSGGL
jgi:hypothetical protein